MTKQHFIRAAEMVKAMLNGEWTDEPPAWADERYGRNINVNRDDWCYTRAVQTAEAFILLLSGVNPRFDQQRFLQACGLVEVPGYTSRSAKTLQVATAKSALRTGNPPIVEQPARKRG